MVGHWFNEGDRQKLLLEANNDFEFLNQDIAVQLAFPEEIYGADEPAELAFIIEQMQKPVADWDVIRIKEHYNTIASRLNDPEWGKKYLIDFSEIPGFLESHGDFINQKATRSKTGGIIIGPYFEGQLWAIYVNTEVAKKMNIQVKQYGMTFEDFISYLEAAYNYNKSNHYIAPIFDDANWISTEVIFKQLFYSLMNSYEESLESNVTEKKIEALRTCYQAMDRMSTLNPIIHSRNTIQWARDNDYPLKDSCLFMVNGTWMYNIWKQKGPEQMGKMMPCELPVFQPSDTYVGGYASNWAVLKNGPHAKEAVRLMMYWCTPRMAEKWVRYTKSPSGIKGTLGATTFGTDIYENFVYSIEQKYGEKQMPQSDNKYLIGENNFTNLRVIDVLERRITGTQAFNELVKTLRK
jgi:ABC-type glycerol-3-phosphate transport system substrate-binding protein